MTAIPADPVGTQQPTEKKNYLNVTTTFMSWAGTLDHKRIGLMYLIGVTFAFLVGGVFALLVRVHLWDAVAGKPLTEYFFEPDRYNQFFTMHGVFMVFMFIIPAIPASLGNFALPLMLGAKDVALPRLNLASFYLWLGGTILAITSMFIGQVDIFFNF